MAAAPSNLTGAALGLAAFALFACVDVSIKFLGADYSPFQIIFFVALMTLPVLAVHAIADPTGAGLRPRRPGLMALRCGVVLINGILGTYAFSVLPLAQAYAIFFTMPIFIAVLSIPVMGETIDLPRGLAILAGLGGVVVALDPVTASLQWGHLAALVGAIVGSANYVIIRKTRNAERPVVLQLYPVLTQFAVAGLVLPLVYVPMPGADLALTAGMAVVSYLGYLLIIAAYRSAPGIVVAPMQYSQILWAALLGALLFGEVMSLRAVLGVVIIVAAGVVIVTRQDRIA